MARFGFVLRRLCYAVPLLLCIVFAVFMILQITPGDPARQAVGLRASEAEVAAVREKLGLNDFVLLQFFRYFAAVLQGDLGYSYKSAQPVASMILERLPVTALLLGVGLLLSLLIAVPVAIFTSKREGGLRHGISQSVEMLGLAMPSFWIGLILILTIALPTGWFPVGGFGETLPQHLRSIFLPAVTLAISIAPLQIRSLRASIVATKHKDFVLLASTIGVPRHRVFGHFVLRNAAAPTVSLLALNIGFLLFDSVVIESTFSLPGLGQGIVLAAKQRDIPSIQGYTLLFALVVVLIYLLADVVNALLDPRIKVES